MKKDVHSKLSQTIWGNFQLSRPVLNVIFACALCFLLVISFVSYKQVKELINANKWVTHTYEVITAIDSAMYSLVDIESRQRGYLLRGSQRFLVDLDGIRANLKLELRKLGHLTRDNPEQKVRIARLMKLVDQRLTLLNQIMELKAQNKLDSPEAAEQLNLSQEMSTRVKDLGRETSSVEMVLLNERNSLALERAARTTSILLISSIASILLFIFAFMVANIELMIRKNTEQHNLNAQSRLRKIIESASDMIAALDQEQRFIIFNEAYQREFKRIFDKSIAVNASLDEVLRDVSPDKHDMAEVWKDALEHNESTKTIEFMLDDDKNIYEMNTSQIQQVDGAIIGLVHSARNITKRVREHTELQESYEKQTEGMQELRNKNEQITLLVEMSDIMLACNSLEELGDVMSKYSQRLLGFASGYLFIMHPSKNYLEKTCYWGAPHTHEQTFTPDQCWAIRLGRLHQANSSPEELVCTHIKTSDVSDSTLLCVPLMAQNDIYGLLHIEVQGKHTTLLDENKRLLLTAFAELTALALANVRLRENLRHQSIRDPLTGLYNRRYLEDFLFKQLHQAERSKSPFAVMMLDLDHFKKINDTWGHEAGDAVLKEFSHILQEDIRLGDLAARYGGEEFLIVFYDITLEAAKMRAESIRLSISKLQVNYGAQPIGQVTVSIGLAMYPADGKTPSELIEAADKALYQAKKNGRNQIVTCSDTSLK